MRAIWVFILIEHQQCCTIQIRFMEFVAHVVPMKFVARVPFHPKSATKHTHEGREYSFYSPLNGHCCLVKNAHHHFALYCFPFGVRILIPTLNNVSSLFITDGKRRFMGGFWGPYHSPASETWGRPPFWCADEQWSTHLSIAAVHGPHPQQYTNCWQASWEEKPAVKGVKGVSPLAPYMDLVTSSLPVDYMHSVLGVVTHMLLNQWFDFKHYREQYYLGHAVSTLDSMLLKPW